MGTYVESLTESLTQQQFPEQRFLEDVDYDDAALEEMLHNVYHSQREGLSVGQSSSPVSERTGRHDVERTGRPVVERGQDLNTEHAQIRTLLDRQREHLFAKCQAEIKKHEFQANYDRRSVRKLSETIESQQEELHQKNFNDEINNFFMHSYNSKTGNYVKLMIKISMKWKN